jgi:tetratricopeptide (TPR) repeat protein
MRGVTAPEGNPRVREGFLKVALEIFARENKGDTYEKAALELGHLQIGQGRFQDALGNFSKIGARSPHRVESLFYSALCLWVERKFEQAALSLKEIPEARRVAAVYNTLGALAIEEHRSPRDAQSRPVVEIGEGMRFLDAALRLTPDDPDIWFNRGLGAMISGDAKTAAANLRKFTEVRPREGDGFFLLAKVLESEGSPDAARFDEQARRLLTKDNRYAKLQVQWKEAGRLDGIFLRIRPIPRNAFLRSLKAHQRPIPAGQGTDRVDEILEDARRLYLADDRESDEKAVELLRRGIYIDRMRAELYHYLGLIALRGKDLAEAEKQFRQSTFWQPDYPEAFTAYAALVRIYIQRKNCLDAQNYFRLAAKADPAREEDLAGLKGMLDRCQN